jgi:hypothetical protein
VPDEEQKPTDKFGPEAMAARIDKMGEETEADRTAREEEQKLLERRKQHKKSGLEAAASKRLARIGETAVKRPSALSADPSLDRATRIGKWIEANRQTFFGLIGVTLIGGGGLGIWWYLQDKQTRDASILLGEAFADDHGHVGAAKDPDDDTAATAKQLYPSFPTTADRRTASLAKYRSLEAKYPGTGAAIVSHLSEGALLLDSGDGAGALAAYDAVATSPLAQADAEVHGRALEGKGFADELLAEKDEANRDKHREDALTAYRALEGVSVEGFKELGMFHQARIAIAQGDKAKAIELLKDVAKRVDDPGQAHSFAYLQFAAEDRLRDLDPSALPAKAPKTATTGGAAGSPDMSDPKIQEIIRQLQMQAKAKGGGGAPPTPVPEPAPPAPESPVPGSP